MGMKCRNPFKPNTRKMRPSKYRAMIDAILICLSGTWICAGYRLACACTFSSEGAKKVCESTSPVINFWVPPAAMMFTSVMPMNPKTVRRYGVTQSMKMGKKQVPRYARDDSGALGGSEWRDELAA